MTNNSFQENVEFLWVFFFFCGASVDALWWRNKTISASILYVATAIWVSFEMLEYHLLTLILMLMKAEGFCIVLGVCLVYSLNNKVWLFHVLSL